MARNFLQLGNGKAKCQLCGDKIKTGIPQISHRAYQSSASFHANAKDCFPRSKAHIKKNGCPHCGVVDIDGFRKRHIYEGFECTHCYQPVSADRYKNAEEYNVEFNEWADQEMNSHGKNISFKDWSKDEGLKHGNTEITEWAQHEDESHDARYGAETEVFNASMYKCPDCSFTGYQDEFLEPLGDGYDAETFASHGEPCS